eukprot:GILJ01026155.1.p1 GENE.GILJ01026155.1~~GILJ01026155.1.p1  ORF type:complete len:350 (+),score=47.30 GILJ01026155.1:442-1491(+)
MFRQYYPNAHRIIEGWEDFLVFKTNTADHQLVEAQQFWNRHRDATCEFADPKNAASDVAHNFYQHVDQNVVLASIKPDFSKIREPMTESTQASLASNGSSTPEELASNSTQASEKAVIKNMTQRSEALTTNKTEDDMKDAELHRAESNALYTVRENDSMTVVESELLFLQTFSNNGSVADQFETVQAYPLVSSSDATRIDAYLAQVAAPMPVSAFELWENAAIECLEPDLILFSRQAFFADLISGPSIVGKLFLELKTPWLGRSTVLVRVSRRMCAVRITAVEPTAKPFTFTKKLDLSKVSDIKMQDGKLIVRTSRGSKLTFAENSNFYPSLRDFSYDFMMEWKQFCQP